MTGAGSTPVTVAPARAARRAVEPGPLPTSIAWSCGPTPVRSTTSSASARRPTSIVRADSSPTTPENPAWSAWWFGAGSMAPGAVAPGSVPPVSGAPVSGGPSRDGDGDGDDGEGSMSRP